MNSSKTMVTIFRNLFNKEPHYISLEEALNRIRTGKSKEKIDDIRKVRDKNKAKSLKQDLPCIRFSGKFESWSDESLIEHNGYMILDFDDVYDVGSKMAEILDKDYVYAAWLSPSGKGVKALIRIADGSKHREHFEALKDEWPVVDDNGHAEMRNGKIVSQLDRSGINVSRICFESYDPSLTVKPDAVPFATIKETEHIEFKTDVTDYQIIFDNLMKWITNRGDAFVTGERNIFLFKLAAACCRFGIPEDDAVSLMIREFKTTGSDCSMDGFKEPIKNAYKANKNRFGSAKFEKDVLIDKETLKEIDIQKDWNEVAGKLKDVVYGIDMKEGSVNLFRFGFPSILGLGVEKLDFLWKPRRKEISAMFGHGNYGKSAYKKWYQVFRAVMFGEKVATFAPEDMAEVYYHELTEVLLGQILTPNNPNRNVTEAEYCNAYDFISEHFFYIYPQELAPTPQYIKEKFLELIVKEGVSWCDIDPFNQMENDYGVFGGRDDQYLSTALSDFKRFAMQNEIFFMILGHPKQMQKDANGNYPEPDYYNYAGGAMWVNKTDNILVYHRPFAQTLPDDPTCMLYTKKIKDQIVVGRKGFIDFTMNRPSRRFIFDGRDYLALAIKEKGLNFKKQYVQASIV